jgi:hypothetical protein
LFVGCSTPTLSPEGKQVRTINTSKAVQCRYVGLVSGHHRVWTGGYVAAQTDVKNKTAAAGGNAVVVLSQSDEYGDGNINAEAYSCQF